MGCLVFETAPFTQHTRSARFSSPVLSFDKSMVAESGNIGHELLKKLRLTFDLTHARREFGGEETR